MASPGPSKRVLGLALAGALALGLIGGCGGDDDGGSGPTALNWFVAIQPGGTIEEVARRCSRESDGRYTVELELLPTDATDQREQLVRRLGAEDSSIDIIGMDVVWTAEFANAGWIRPWTGGAAERVTENVFGSVVESATYEGELYGAPFNSNTQLLWYRKDLVDEPPATWAEMVREAERQDSLIQVQAARYEGFTVWVNTLIESAGTQVLSGPEEIDLAEGPTEDALAVIGELARSSAAAPNISTAEEEQAIQGFENGGSAFMLNYTFAFASVEENAPEVFEQMGFAKLPRVLEGEPSRPPLGGFNLGVSAYSDEPELAFEAATCLSNAESQLTATELDGLPPSRRDLYGDQVVQEAFPGFAGLVARSIDDAAPRPSTPAYTDISLAIQRALHPPSSIDPQDPASAYEELREKVEDGVNREGLL